MIDLQISNNNTPTLRLPSKTKLQKMAGIIKPEDVTILRIPSVKEPVYLNYVPNWFEKLKYKVCGFEYSPIKTEERIREVTIDQEFEEISHLEEK
jgi:hypothetical protein